MLLPHIIISRGVLIKFNLQERKKIKILFLQDIMYYAINYLLMNSFLSVSANRISDIHTYTIFMWSKPQKSCVLDYMSITYICLVKKTTSIVLQQPFTEVQTGVLKNFTIFTRKHMCWSLFKIKFQGYSSETLLKRNSNTGVFLWILWNF